MLYSLRSSVLLPSVLIAFALTTSGCDFGGAKNAFESVGIAIELDTIQTTVTSTFTKAHTGALAKIPVTVRYKGPDANAAIDMYSDPLQQQRVRGGATSFGLRNSRRPTTQHPLRLQLAIDADGYQPTTQTVEVHSTGITAVTTPLLSTNPNRQPKGTSGLRTRSGTMTADGTLQRDVDVRTPSASTHGGIHLHLPKGARLYGDMAPAQGRLTTRLIHYPAHGPALHALPGNGIVEDAGAAARFGLIGYMSLTMQDARGQSVSRVASSPEGPAPAHIWAHLPKKAVHPATGGPLRAGDAVTLYRYHPSSGVWSRDTTVTVRDRQAAKRAGDLPSSTTASHDSGGDLGLQWTSWARSVSQLWAWGVPPSSSCPAQAQVDVAPNGHTGTLQVTLHRPGYAFRATTFVDDLTDGRLPFSQLVNRASVPDASDYTLTLTLPSGKSVTTEHVNPCSGTSSIALPSAPASAQTDVLLRGIPTCPGDQKVRVSALPTFPVYYREQGAPIWQVAARNRINWVMNDPDSPTSVEAAELRLDGLKPNTDYKVFTVYDGVRHDAQGYVPDRSTASVEEDRVVVEHRQDFSNACS